MKISNINTTLNVAQNNNNYKTNFKANRIVQKQMNSMINGEGRYVFQMLVGALGLSSIISWVNALKDEDPARVNKRLDAYSNKLNVEWRELMLEDANRALDKASEIDAIESSIWTRGRVYKGENPPKINPVQPLQKEMFFNKRATGIFLDSNAEAALKTTQRYVDAFLESTLEVKDKMLKDVEKRFDFFVRTANEMKYSRETSKLFEKLSNIAKLYVLTNLVKVFPQKEERSFTRSNEFKEAQNIYETQEISEGFSVKEQVAAIMQASINSENDIDEDLVLSNKVITEKISAAQCVQPYVYRPHFALIKNIYNALGAKNGTIFLNDIVTCDRSQELAKYNEYGKGEHKAFSFRDFALLEEMKKYYKSSLTQQEFDKINQYYETCIDIFKSNILEKEKNNFEIKFKKDAFLSVQERLKVIVDLFPIAFNATEEEMIKPYEETESVGFNKVVQELVFRLAKQSIGKEENEFRGYENTMKFLGFDEKDLQNIREVVDNRGYKTAETYLRELVDNKNCAEKFEKLCDALNNPIFNKYMKTVHVRMRFLERFVLNQDGISDSVDSLKAKTVDAVNELEKNMYSQFKTKVTRYMTVKKDEEGNILEIKKCPQIVVNGTLISLNSDGGFHTIF